MRIAFSVHSPLAAPKFVDMRRASFLRNAYPLCYRHSLPNIDYLW